MVTNLGTRSSFLASLRGIVGNNQVISSHRKTKSYRTGIRFGGGKALAVVRPGTLLEQWHVLKLCLAEDVIVICQASNTGLTGGSTPAPKGYDRDVVIISTSRLSGIFLLDEGRQVICLPGATLHELEQRLQPLGREPHSVIGSSCFGASVIGGVCNNSGGALTRRGPAYTEMALFAQIAADGTLGLVNHLGISLGDDPETILARAQAGDFDVADAADSGRAASDRDYEHHVREIDADTPARFNGDARRLHEAAGCAGKLMVFAVRLDTFVAEDHPLTFYIGSNEPSRLAWLRRLILRECVSLPIAAEYLHRDAFDLADRYGKDQFLLIQWLGTKRLPAFFRLKTYVDALLSELPLPADMTDRLLFGLARLWPNHLPKRLRAWRANYDHHLLLRVSRDAVNDMRRLLDRWRNDSSDWFECSETEAEKAFLHRFVTAGAAVRYRAVHRKDVAGIVSLDIALRRNDPDWFEALPPDLDEALVRKIYYGHFLCSVFHQDYVVAPGHDCLAVEHRMWKLLDQRGARYPAEHNVGHLYDAAPALADFYRSLDPGNRMNAGIGGMSKLRHYATGPTLQAERTPLRSRRPLIARNDQ